MVNASDSHGNAYGVFISPEGWRTLAGGNTPGDRPVFLHPGGVPENPLRSQTTSNSKSALAHPKSTVDLGCEPLIKVENGLISTPPQTSYKPIIRPENKGIKPKSNRHKPKKF